MKSSNLFLKDSENKAFSEQHRRTVSFNIGKYDHKVKEGKLQFFNLENARKYAKNAKWAVMEKLPELLEEFEAHFSSRGGKVIWAEDAAEALNAIADICQKHNIRTAVKSKSMITEEIELNPFLEKLNIEVLETDLGEFIVQLRGEAPYHIVTPAMHLNKREIAELFHNIYNTPPDASPEELTLFVRQLIREKFESADLGITGANFLISETGSVALTENEGNARMVTSYPRIHIVIAGIEKVLAKMADLEIFWPLLSTFGTGQQLTVYNSLLNGPKLHEEDNGPEQMYVILLDNGRSKMFADEKKREALYCIRCGSCLNACPVYRTVGGHTYNAAYSGPIGAVIMQDLGGIPKYKHLSHASSLCAACTENCPVNINLHHLLVYNRRVASKKHSKLPEKAIWTFWKTAMKKRKRMNASPIIKNFMIKIFFKSAWGIRRDFPDFQGSSFNELWEKGKV